MKFNPHSVAAVFFLLCIPTVISDLESDRRALLALRDGIKGRTLLWNLTASPCTWGGVYCNSGRVISLRLPGVGSSGSLPDAIGNLTELQTLSLRRNSLTGPIPSDFSNLKHLRHLYLQENAFSGDIPAFLFTLPSLIRVNLAHNNFSGRIPDNINSANRLLSLSMADNQLTGPIPDITIPLSQFNVSNNELSGSIPIGLSGFPSSAFEGNSLCGKPLNPCDGDNPTPSEGDKLSGGVIAGIVIACCVVALLLILLIVFLCKKKKKSGDAQQRTPKAPPATSTDVPAKWTIDDSPPPPASHGKDLTFLVKPHLKFDLDGLMKASAEVLGKGTVGSSYKANFDDGLVVAVKRLRDVVVPEKEFREKMEMLGSMNHANLATLMAYYYSHDEKLLISHYIPKGSLSSLLHDNKGSGIAPLSWERRATIAMGAARAIAYIHSQDSATSHGNVKSSNILVSDSYEAKVSDFCLAPLIRTTSEPNRLDGYLAPEVTDGRKISQKADVYSFGVVLLELLTGKSPAHQLVNEEGVDLPKWVQSMAEQQSPSDVFDPDLARDQSDGKEKMIRLLKIGLSCTAQYPDSRPSMDQVRSLLNEIVGSPSPSPTPCSD